MKKTVWTFGLISGGILAAMMLITIPFESALDFGRSEIIGYATMVLSFLLIFFGIRSYRDNVAGGSVSFGQAFKAGALIALIASVCYVGTWELINYKIAPEFGEKFLAANLEKIRTSGASAEEIQRKTAAAERFAERYKNPFFNVAVTFIEPLPLGLIVALISAGVLSRRRKGANAALAGDGTTLRFS
jgi:hypothetical protein